MTIRTLILALGLALMAPVALAEPVVTSLPVEALAPGMVAPDHALILDVREPDEFASGHVPGALNVPLKQVSAWAKDQPKDRPLFVICHSGRRSLKASNELVTLGFTQVTNVQGGIKAWQEHGLPVETPVTTPVATP